MSATRNDFQTVIATLVELYATLERLRGEFVHGIKTPADYARATDLLDELTDGRELSKVEEKILVQLEDEILAYQRDSDQFRESNAAFEATCTPVQLIKDLTETLVLTGLDLPETGDKTAVSKVLDQGLTEMEDYYLGAEVLERVRKGQEAVHSVAVVRKDLGLDD